MKNVIELIKERREAAKDAGFSLLELVVAVGILLVLTVGGLLAYNGITQNAREAAVESAVSEIYTAAAAYEADNNSTTNAARAAQEWEDSQKGAPNGEFTATADTTDDGEIWVTVSSNTHEGVSAQRGPVPAGGE